MTFKFEAPVKTISEANNRDHWRLRNVRRKEQKRDVFFSWNAALRGKRLRPAVPCTVKLTRLGPKLLDSHDNLPISCKAVADQIAELLGVDDADPRIKFEYEQIQSTRYGVVIEVVPG